MSKNKNNEQTYNIPEAFEWSMLGIGLLVFVISVFMGYREDVQSNDEIETLQTEATQLRSEVLARRDEERILKNKVIYETTGIDPDTIRKDKVIYEDFIKPAFEWTNGEEYDEVRADYIERLGENSSFVSTYIAENIKVDDYNFVDVKGIKSKYLSSEVYPLDSRDGSMDYLGVVQYYVYKESQDLVGVNRLPSSTAIVRYTISGDGDLRTVSNIEAIHGIMSD